MRVLVVLAACLVPGAVAQTLSTGGDAVPRLRSVDVGAQRIGGPGVAWTTALTEANAPGIAWPAGVDGAPDGELCALSLESLSSTTRRVVVRRYAAGGAELWAHPVDTWGATAAPSEVVADGTACIASALFRDNGVEAVGVARLGAGGPVFATRLSVPSRPARALVRPDGSGGAWLGVGGSAVGDVMLRVDAAGHEAVRLETTDGTDALPRGVRDVAVTADGRAVFTSTGSRVRVVAPDGTVEVDAGTHSAPDPIALALDGADGVLVFGVTPPGGAGNRSVRRYALDGTVSWTRTLGLSSAADTERLHTLVAVGGDAVVLWTDDDGTPTATRLGGTTGSVVWSQALGPFGFRPTEIVASGDDVVIRLEGFEPEWIALDAASGATQWSVLAGSESFWVPTWRTLALCGTGTCIQGSPAPDDYGRVTVTARTAGGAVAWSAERTGHPTASRRLTDVAPAPDGGVVAVGTTVGAQETELLAVRLSDLGDVDWAVALDAGDLFHETASTDGGVALADGGALVAGTTRRAIGNVAFVARVAPDGSLAWLTIPDQTFSMAQAVSVVAVPDGGALLATGEAGSPPAFTGTVTRLDADGAVVWQTGLGASRYPTALFETPTGSAVVMLDGTDLTDLALEVAHLGADGTLAPASRYETTCTFPSPTGPIPAGISADGTVTVALSDPCDGPSLVRFALDGTSTSRTVGLPSTVVSALDVTAGGDAVLAYGDINQFGLVRVKPDGGTEWNTGLTLSGDTPSVAARPGGGAVSVRIAPDADGLDAPSVLVITPSGGTSPIGLSTPAGLPASRVAPSRVALSSESGAYVLVNGAIAGESAPSVPAVSRVAGLVVAGEPAPVAAPRLLRRLGPNPLDSGSPLRIALSAPAATEVADVRGRRLAAWPLAAGEQTLALPNLPPGVYVIRVQSDDASEAVHIVVR